MKSGVQNSRKALELVRMATGRNELIAVIVITLVIVAGQSWYVNQHGRDEKEEVLYDWQVSSFQSFGNADQAIYNSLYTVKDEIPYIYEDINRRNKPEEIYRWPSIAILEDYLLPPFYRDTSWRQTGGMRWSLFEPKAEGEMQGYSMYLGTNGRIVDQGSFLLTIGHVHAGLENNNSLEIWWHSSNRQTMPDSGFKDVLIREGWKLVVPHSGQDEVERLYGEN